MSFRNWLFSAVFLPAFALPGLTQGAPASIRLFFPPVSLADGETAQLNIAAIASDDASDGSCSGSILFTNPSGPVSDPLPFTVSAGQISAATYPNSSGGRAELLVSILQSPQAGGTAQCLFSLELLGSGSHVVLANPAALPGDIRSQR